MTDPIILASGSQIRRTLLRNAGVKCDTALAAIDEDTICAAMALDGAKPRDIADALAEQKARKVSLKNPQAFVIGCDQVLDFGGSVLRKPVDQQDAKTQLQALSGQQHELLSAVVVCERGAPVWRHVGTARLEMRALSDHYIDTYLSRNWPGIRHSVGCYKLEEEGVRLFSRITGDYFTVLGLPLVELLGYLTLRGVLQG